MSEIEAQGGGLKLHLDYDTRVNYALHQNAVPLVNLLRVENVPGAGRQEGLELELLAADGLSEPWRAAVPPLQPGQVWTAEVVDLRVRGERLRSQQERLLSRLELSIRRDGQELVRQSYPLEVLAVNEWGGLGTLPEALAAFVLPNQAAVAEVLRAAAAQVGGDGLTGYAAKDPGAVRRAAAAIYQAVAGLELAYAPPPASFEDTGQKVRFPDQVRQERLASCLDLVLLLAACLEQAGLYPLLLLRGGHAAVGVWLEPRHFPTASVEDGLAVRKRVELGELLVLETTFATRRPPPPFEQAVVEGRGFLADLGTFLAAIDVAAARVAKIQPIDLGAGGPPSAPTAPAAPAPVRQAAPATTTGPARPGASSGRLRPDGSGGSPRLARVEAWKKRLLDLSLRSRFINFKEGKQAVPLEVPDLAGFEDSLAKGMAFELQARSELMEGSDPRDAKAFAARTGEDARRAHLLERLKRGLLHSRLAPAELEKRLLAAWREARTSQEETGSSTLFLALGFLEWFESPSSEEARRAPILLYPARLDRAAGRFQLRLSDEDPQLNVTLLEKLRAEFGQVPLQGLDELIEDESGLDVPELLRRWRQAVAEVPRWQVLEEAALGQFNFTKFVMWRDLVNNQEALLEQPVAEHLVKQAERAFGQGEAFPAAERLDDLLDPAETYCPLDADSSQLRAIAAVSEGRSFVLQGPPGTGKSQTITNLIAHSLGRGKRVLFVAEKAAALNVVHQRLQKVGLAPFCLELHSHKATKGAVYEQLQQAWEAVNARSPLAWRERAKELRALRLDLNAYAAALHQPRKLGKSVFRAQSELVGLGGAPKVALPQATCADADPARASWLLDLAEQVGHARRALSADPGVHPLRRVGLKEAPLDLEALRGQLRAFLSGANRLVQAFQPLESTLGLAAVPLLTAASWSRLRALGECLSLLPRCPGDPRALLAEASWPEARAKLERLLKEGKATHERRRELTERYGADFWGLDPAALVPRLERAVRSFPLWRCLPVRAIRRKVAVAIGGEPPDNAKLLLHLKQAGQVRDQETRLDDPGCDGLRLFGAAWQGAERDWERLGELVSWVEGFRQALDRLEQPADPALSGLRAGLIRLAGAWAGAQGGGLRAPLGELFQALAELAELRAGLVEALALDPQATWGGDAGAGGVPAARAALATLEAGLDELPDWCRWVRVAAKASSSGLAPLVAATADGRVTAEQVPDAFRRGFLEGWLASIRQGDEVLRRFDSHEHARKVRKFRDLDQELLQLSRQQLQALLAEKVPQPGMRSPAESESGILSRQLLLKRRQMPIRRLFAALPGLLPRLKPVMLMSPLSVAQYLDPHKFPPFDVVVFDEASQMPAWDAVGALGRGRQAVVVGDSKQLPPTSFFSKVLGGEEAGQGDEDADVEEVESVLEECVAAQLPQLTLDWHYRSRHESLIAFSNSHYYNNRLLTFPSAADRVAGLGVELRYLPDAVYDRGGSRTNRAEAEAVVAEVVARLLAAGGDRGAPSLGVVTFSQAQQTLVEDLLDKARRDHPQIEDYFGPNVEEPVFVKNLENVQGDERDVILFSICYGPDATGRVAMQFGPLLRQGGERRLNVAITRAREQVLVFTCLRPEQIDLARTQALGVKHLKTFLDYAERGPRAIAEAVTPDPDADFDSPFEQAVHRELTARGHDVDLQVGCSGYRIDLAVRDPDAPGRYLLGIECDGASYHSGRTARDRDRLRQAVLEHLGWQIHRVWSTDWLSNPARELEKLGQAIEAARAEQRARDAEAARAREARASVRIEAPPEPEPTPGVRLLTATGGVGSSGRAAASESGRVSLAIPSAATAALTSDPEPAPLPLLRGQLLYRAGPPLPALGQPDDLYGPRALAQLAPSLTAVIQAESPLALVELSRRVAAAYGIGRTTQRVRDRVTELLRQLPRATGCAARLEGDFVWGPADSPASYRAFRTPSGQGEEGVRKLEEIAPVELANAAGALLEQFVSAPEDQLVRELARVFGIKRTGKKVNEAALLGIEELVRRGGAVRDGEVLRHPG